MKRRLKAGKSRNSGFSLNVLTDDEVHEIHLATLEVLKDVGGFVENEEALERFDGGGCDVDRNNRVVKFPHWVIEDAINSAPGMISPLQWMSSRRWASARIICHIRPPTNTCIRNHQHD